MRKTDATAATIDFGSFGAFLSHQEHGDTGKKTRSTESRNQPTLTASESSIKSHLQSGFKVRVRVRLYTVTLTITHAPQTWKSSFTFLTFGLPTMTVLWCIFLFTITYVYDGLTGTYESRLLGVADRATLAFCFTIFVAFPFAVVVPIALLFNPVLDTRWHLVAASSMPGILKP